LCVASFDGWLSGLQRVYINMHCNVVVGRFSAKHPGFAPRHGLLCNSTYYIGIHGPGHKLGIQCCWSGHGRLHSPGSSGSCCCCPPGAPLVPSVLLALNVTALGVMEVQLLLCLGRCTCLSGLLI